MNANQLAALSRIGITPRGNQIRVPNRQGRLVYVRDFAKHRNAIADYYHTTPDAFMQALDARERVISHSITNSRHAEIHLFKHVDGSTFLGELELLLRSQDKAFKCQIQFGYELISVGGDEERDYYASNNTSLFKDGPVAINSRTDIDSKILDQMRTGNYVESLSRPNSGWRVRDINEFKVVIFKRQHSLGDDVEVPDCIRKNKYIINPKRTRNKCVFACLALAAGEKPTCLERKMKELVAKYCAATDREYSVKFYKEIEAIDLFEFDRLEQIFETRIEVYQMDLTTGCGNRIRDSQAIFDKTLNILDYEGHAMFIRDVDMVMGRYPCRKCSMIFGNKQQRFDHEKNQCDVPYFEVFRDKPTPYRPRGNAIAAMAKKYGVKLANHYLDHYIVFDFEAILAKRAVDPEARTKFVAEHIPVSVSLCDSLTKQTVCFVNENPYQLMRDMFSHVSKVWCEIVEYYALTKFSGLMDAMDKKHNELLKAERNKLDVKNQITAIVADEKTLERLMEQVPLIGFNSGRYDINMIKRYLFDAINEKKEDPEDSDRSKLSVIKGATGYMAIAGSYFKMLDITFYLPPGTSYAKYLSTYLGVCQCEDKIRCTCGLGKGLWCYEYLDSFDRLSETALPPKSAFDSKLRGTSISDADYERLQWVWNHYGMKTLKDLLIWYNNLDVAPFVEAISIHRKQYRLYGLDMFADGVSLPGLAERILYQIAYDQLPNPKRQGSTRFLFPESRLSGYRAQDAKAAREFDLSIAHCDEILAKQYFCCEYCREALSPETVSADRKDNALGHIDGNIVMACVKCNVARADRSMASFKYQSFLDYNKNRIVFSIDNDQKEIYHLMKRNIAGGPSIIFNRFAKRDLTTIRGGKLCKKIIGYDANALYLWCLGNVMPCGRLTQEDAYDGIVDDILNDRAFGFLECDIRVPDHLREHFSEMCPIFKTIEIDPSDRTVIGDHMFEYNESRGASKSKLKSRKLIGSLFGKQILIYAPLLKWYLSHGLVITKTYSFVRAAAHRPFKQFMLDVSNARRGGDADKSKAMIAEMMKLVGNSAFGRSGMDMAKHKAVSYTSDSKKIDAAIEHFGFQDIDSIGNGMRQVGDETYEIVKNKRRLKLHNPIHLSIAIYQLAKLRMLEFYYDCIDTYFDRSDFQYQEMDTDSAYIAFSAEHPFEQLIKPEMREHFARHKHEWFPRDDTPEHAKYDRRTPGLFKDEWRGDAMVSLSPKNYFCYEPDEGHHEKCSAKGVQKSRNGAILSADAFESVIQRRITLQATNKGFRVDARTQTMITYEQVKSGIGYYYDKRQVLADGISTAPLPL